MSDLSHSCPNCNSALAGPWCHTCGQKDIDLERPFLNLAGHTIGETFDIDGKFLRSFLWLFMKPGKLGLMWMDGQRTARSSPIRMFLFIGFLAALILTAQVRSMRVDLEQNYPDTVATLQGDSLIFDMSKDGINATLQFDRVGTLLDPAFKRLDGQPVSESLTKILNGGVDAIIQVSLLSLVVMALFWKLLVRRRPLIGHLVVSLDFLSYTYALGGVALVLHHLIGGLISGSSTALTVMVPTLLLHHIYGTAGTAYGLHGWSKVWRTAAVASVSFFTGVFVLVAASVVSISSM